MTFDFEAHLRAARRSVVSLEVDGKAAHAVTLARPYATTVEDLWDAVTTPERLARWFLPVSGDLELGGRFKFAGNAEGEIRECQRPTLLATTWEIGGDTSWVRVELSSVETERALLTLTHTVLHSSHWDTYGSGATGIGWEIAAAALSHCLANPNETFDEAKVFASAEGKTWIRTSSVGWRDASVSGGEEETAADSAEAKTAAFYTGESTD